jgi:hypothetical protein
MVETDEELEEAARLDEVRRLAAELRREWRVCQRLAADWSAGPSEQWAA